MGTFSRDGDMADVVKVDERGRIKLSREVAQPGGSVVIIDARSYFVGIPIPPDPVQASGSWLSLKHDVAALKETAEREASNDAVRRAVRRRQIRP